MSVVFDVFFILLFGYGMILAFGNLYISIKTAYTIIKKRRREYQPYSSLRGGRFDVSLSAILLLQIFVISFISRLAFS